LASAPVWEMEGCALFPWRQAVEAQGAARQPGTRSFAFPLAIGAVACLALRESAAAGVSAFCFHRMGSTTSGSLALPAILFPSLTYVVGKPIAPAMPGFTRLQHKLVPQMWLLFLGAACRTSGRRKVCRAALANLKGAELKALCKERGLPVSGSKATLIARLEAAGSSNGRQNEQVAEENTTENSRVDEETGAEKTSNAKQALGDLKGAELKALCRERGLLVSGSKATLIARLEAAGSSNGDQDEEVRKEDQETEEEDEDHGEEEEEKQEEDEETASEEEETKKASRGKAGLASTSEYTAGQLALAKFADDGKFYSVRLVKDNGDGTWNIVWVEDDAEDTAVLADLKPQTKSFAPGDLVIAKCEDGYRYTAEVNKDSGNGWVDVEWLEEGGREAVLLDDTFTSDKHFKVGDAIEGKFPDDGAFYGAKVLKDLGRGRYVVEWDEDDDGQGTELFVDSMRLPRVDISTLEIGQELKATVLRIVGFGAFVDVGGSTDGLIHCSQMAAKFVNNPSDIVEEGQELRVWVTRVHPETNRLNLTMLESRARGLGGKSGGKGR